MISRRDLGRQIANERVDLQFYLVIERDGKKLLRPLKMDVQVPLKLIRAIADDTIIPGFYQTLAKDLRERGVPAGSKVQLRAKFRPEHEMVDPSLKGTRVLCEVDV